MPDGRCKNANDKIWTASLCWNDLRRGLRIIALISQLAASAACKQERALCFYFYSRGSQTKAQKEEKWVSAGASAFHCSNDGLTDVCLAAGKSCCRLSSLSHLRVYKFEPRDKRRALFFMPASLRSLRFYLKRPVRRPATLLILFILRSFGIRLDRLYRYFICSFLGCARRKNSLADAYLERAVSTSARANWWKTPLSFVNFDAEHSQHLLPGWSTDTFLALHCQISLFSIQQHANKFFKIGWLAKSLFTNQLICFIRIFCQALKFILLVVSACVCL